MQSEKKLTWKVDLCNFICKRSLLLGINLSCAIKSKSWPEPDVTLLLHTPIYVSPLWSFLLHLTGFWFNRLVIIILNNRDHHNHHHHHHHHHGRLITSTITLPLLPLPRWIHIHGFCLWSHDCQCWRGLDECLLVLCYQLLPSLRTWTHVHTTSMVRHRFLLTAQDSNTVNWWRTIKR